MLLLSATDVSIALASKAGTLRLVERQSRLGGTFVSIEDDKGVLTVEDDMAAAVAFIAAIAKRAGL